MSLQIMQNSTQMKKTLLVLSTCFIFSTLSFPTFAKSERVEAFHQQSQQQLVDDWVDYKLIQFNFTEETKNESDLLRQQLENEKNPDTEKFQKMISELSLKHGNTLLKKFQAFKPRTTRMQQLLALQIQNTNNVLALFPGLVSEHTSTEWDDAAQAEKDNKFKQASKITEQVAEMEYEIETEVFRYLQSQRPYATQP